jgi:hypothetical protein
MFHGSDEGAQLRKANRFLKYTGDPMLSKTNMALFLKLYSYES